MRRDVDEASRSIHDTILPLDQRDSFKTLSEALGDSRFDPMNETLSDTEASEVSSECGDLQLHHGHNAGQSEESDKAIPPLDVWLLRQIEERGLEGKEVRSLLITHANVREAWQYNQKRDQEFEERMRKGVKDGDLRYVAPESEADKILVQRALELTRIDFFEEAGKAPPGHLAVDFREESYATQYHRLQRAYEGTCKGESAKADLFFLPKPWRKLFFPSGDEQNWRFWRFMTHESKYLHARLWEADELEKEAGRVVVKPVR